MNFQINFQFSILNKESHYKIGRRKSLHTNDLPLTPSIGLSAKGRGTTVTQG